MKFRRRPIVVEAVQWFPGLQIDGVITDPKELVGKPWAHLGHQRELDGSHGIVEATRGEAFVSPGDWIIQDKFGKYTILSSYVFERLYEPL